MLNNDNLLGLGDVELINVISTFTPWQSNSNLSI